MEFVRLRLNVEEVNSLIEEKFRGNQTWFAEEIGVDVSYLNQILNKKVGNHSPKVIKNFMNYCKKNNINEKKYLFLG